MNIIRKKYRSEPSQTLLTSANGNASGHFRIACILRRFNTLQTTACRGPVKCLQKAMRRSRKSAMPAAWEAAAISAKSFGNASYALHRSIGKTGRIVIDNGGNYIFSLQIPHYNNTHNRKRLPSEGLLCIRKQQTISFRLHQKTISIGRTLMHTQITDNILPSTPEDHFHREDSYALRSNRFFRNCKSGYSKADCTNKRTDTGILFL